MKKRLSITILIALMLTGIVAGCKESNEVWEYEKGMTKLVISFRTNGSVPAENEIQRVEEALNEILSQKIEAQVELVILDSASYKQQIALMLSGDEQLDVMGITPQMLSAAVAGNQLLALDELLDEYGQGIKDELTEELLSCGEINGIQYTIPVQADSAVGMGYYVMRKDIVDKYNIDFASIKTYDDLTAVFQLVHNNEPDMFIVAPRNAGMSFLEYNCSWDKLTDCFGVLENYGQDELKVVNLFETKAYKQYLEVVHEWYERGFISHNITNSIEDGPTQMKEGTLFAYAHANKPGVLTQESQFTGCEVVGAQVLETMSYTTNAWQWTVPASSNEPEKAMAFLNCLYTDPEVINLLVYGIEDEDYVVLDNGKITYPTDVDASTVGYSMSAMIWSFGNEFNAYIWESNDANLWAQTQAWNQTGYISKAYGFMFDSTRVSIEMAAVQSVYEQYCMALECGVLSRKDSLDEMNEKLYAAGLQEIINEKQTQLNVWKSSKE